MPSSEFANGSSPRGGAGERYGEFAHGPGIDAQQRPTVHNLDVSRANLSPVTRRPSRWLSVLGLGVVALLGIALGLFVGAPTAAERYALGLVGRLESRFGVELSADAVEWTWGGKVRVTNLRVASSGVPLATVRAVELELDVSFFDRSARLVSAAFDGPRIELIRRADGSTNLDAVLAALRSKKGGAGVSKLDLASAAIRIDDLEVVVAPGMAAADIEIPPRIELRHGKVAFDRAEGLLRIAFADTSLDPGQPFSVELGFAEDGWLTPPLGPLGRLDRVAVSPARPVRFWLGERVVGLGGVALTREGLELFPFQLSVPVAHRAPTGEVSAAATVGRVVIGVPDLARLLEPGALGRLAGDVRAAIRGDKPSPLARLHLASPVVALSIDGARHSFEDLVGLVGVAAEPAAVPSLPPEDEKLLIKANVAAAERLLRAPRSERSSTSQGRVSSAPLALAVSGPVGRLGAAMTTVFERLERLRDRLGVLQAMTGELEVDGGELELAIATSTPGRAADTNLDLALTGVRATLVRAPGDTHTDLVAHLSADNPFARGQRLEASLRAPTADTVAPYVWSVQVASLPLAVLGELPRRFHLGPRGSVGLVLGGTLTSTRLDATFDVTLDGVTFNHPAVARDPLTLNGRITGRLTFEPVTQTLVVSELTFRSGQLGITGSLDIASATSAPRLRLALELADTPIQQVIDEIPDGFAPLLSGLKMDGTLGWRLVVDLDTTQPAAVVVDSQPRARGLRVLSLGERLDFQALRTSHAYTIRLFDGTPGTRVVGPATASWVPLAQITPHLPLALTTTEDGTFYTNDGISTFAMKESIATNLERGTFARGASTITQQLVKNLFLGGDKTVSRKLQEVFIAWQLAQFLSKDEVMALYLNAIEFGPGIYGIGDAAWHWFGKRPIDLTLAEAVFLASIVPGPRRYYTFYEQGGITPRWTNYVQSLLKVMVDRKKITADELTASLPVQVRFRGHGGGYTDDAPPDFDLVPDRDDLVEPSPDTPED